MYVLRMFNRTSGVPRGEVWVQTPIESSESFWMCVRTKYCPSH